MIDPVRHYSITDQVYDALKERILLRTVQPGERLLLNELEQQLGVSRTPLKDALNRLAMEGLVEVYPRKGTFVTSLTSETLREVFDIRLLMELYAGEQGITRITPAQLGKMRGLVKELERNIDAGNETYIDYGQFISRDQNLHLLLIGLAGNQTLLEMYRSLNVHVQIARGFYTRMDRRVRHTHEEHKTILRAYESGDANLLRETLTLHICSVRQLMARFVEGSGSI